MTTPYTPSAWDEPRPAQRVLRPLDRPLLVEAAIRLADDEGLEAVSIRGVAAALGVGPMRLYRQVETKEELLDLMVEAAYGEFETVSSSLRPGVSDAKQRLHDVAARFRTVAFRHEWFVDLLGGRPRIGPNALEVLEVTAAAIDQLARPDSTEVLWSMLGAFNAYLLGATRADVVERRTSRLSQQNEMAWQTSITPHLDRMFASGRFPTLQRIAESGAPPAMNEDFQWGLDAILNGLTIDR